jgi:hypothetical protein
MSDPKRFRSRNISQHPTAAAGPFTCEDRPKIANNADLRTIRPAPPGTL